MNEGYPNYTNQSPDYDPYSTYHDAPFDREVFLSFWPEFNDTTVYPSELVENIGKRARFYVTGDNSMHLDGEDRNYARSLMTAHMIVLAVRARTLATNQSTTGSGGAAGSVGGVGGSGILQSASVGGVSVSMAVPQSNDAWSYWLNQTPYGQEYLAFMSLHCPMGIYGMGECHRVLR